MSEISKTNYIRDFVLGNAIGAATVVTMAENANHSIPPIYNGLIVATGVAAATLNRDLFSRVPIHISTSGIGIILAVSFAIATEINENGFPDVMREEIPSLNRPLEGGNVCRRNRCIL